MHRLWQPFVTPPLAIALNPPIGYENVRDSHGFYAAHSGWSITWIAPPVRELPGKASAMGYVFRIPVILCWSLAAVLAAPSDGSPSVTNIFAPLSTPAEAIYEN